MKLLFDLTYVNPTSYSGIVVYALRLLKGFQESEKKNDIVLLVTDNNIDFIKKEYSAFQTISIQIKESVFLTKFNFLKGYVYKKEINNIINENNISLLVSPYLNISSLFTTLIPQIGVLHDAQSYVFNRNMRLKGKLYNLFIVRLLRKMTHIVTISHYAKESILKEIPPLGVPISVIYNSVEVSHCVKKLISENKTPYILYVNTLEPYKNLETLVKAFGLLKGSIKHNLIVKAKKLPYWDTIIVPLLKKYDISDSVFLIENKYSNEKMASLFSEADLFVSPSLMEGFGFTPIEAAMHYVPVISSKESALYETTMGLLNYYEPANDFKQLANVIDKLLINKPSKEELIKISNCFKQTYSTKQQALLFIKLFKEFK